MFRNPVKYLPILIVPGVLMFLLGLSGCSTLQADIQFDPTGDVHFQELETLELTLVNIRLRIRENDGKPDKLITADLVEVRDTADELASGESLNRQYTARLESIRGLEAWLSSDYRRAGRHLGAALEVWELDELSMVLESLLTDNDEASLAFLESRIIAGENLYRLEAEKGATLFALGRYGEAVALWDAVLPFLPEAYQNLFSRDRAKAWVLKDSDTGMGLGSADLLDEGPLSLGNMVKVTQSESTLFDGIDRGRDLEGSELFDFLKQDGYLSSLASENSDTMRRDAAMFLWNLLAEKLNDPSLLEGFSSRFRGRPSPIPDVEVSDPWFDAVLGCVQNEIMSLPDGRKFLPDQVASGLDYIGWLEAVIAY